MAILVKSKTCEAVKNKWATRWECFFDARYVFKRDTGKDLVLDVAAEPQTAKLDRYYISPHWISEQSNDYDELVDYSILSRFDSERFDSQPLCVGFDALQNDWCDGWWCNPPFDLKREFIIKATEEMFKGHDGIMLIPYEPLSGWWLDLVEGYASVIYEPNGRYAFYESDGKTKKSGVNFGSVLVLFTRRKLGVPRVKIRRGIGCNNLKEIN